MTAKFIWNNRKHEVKYRLLTQMKGKGGLDAPNIQNYYSETQVLIIIKWMRCDTNIKWINIEKELTKGLIGTLPY